MKTNTAQKLALAQTNPKPYGAVIIIAERTMARQHRAEMVADLTIKGAALLSLVTLGLLVQAVAGL